MKSERPALDHIDLPTYLQIDSAPSHGFRVTLRVSALGLVFEAVASDIGDAIHCAADDCARRLQEEGYAVTAADVLSSLEKIEGAERRAERSS